MQSVLSFLRGIGLVVLECRLHVKPHVPHVWIHQGIIFVDTVHAHVGDLLHECGHLATTPAALRSYIRAGSVDQAPFINAFGRYMERHQSSMLSMPTHLWDKSADGQAWWAGMQSGEQAAIAWSWAAGDACGVPPIDRLGDGDAFGGEDGRESVRMYLNKVSGDPWSAGLHIGVSDLNHSGMTTKTLFPRMIRWLQR